MRYAGCVILTLCAAVLLGAFRTDSVGQEKKTRKVKPLSLEGFLDEKLPETPQMKVKLNVDNSACYVCHVNYETDGLVVTHGKEEIGCIDCHGESLDHRNDEDNITPPDIMYPLDTIDEKCWECHDGHDVPATEVIARWQERCPEKTDPKKVVCTDCHFQHRLERRTVRWNKQTGELIVRELQEKTQKLRKKRTKKQG
jgi:formate-dependent nitrite reductase cytochrome c552 subunit